MDISHLLILAAGIVIGLSLARLRDAGEQSPPVSRPMNEARSDGVADLLEHMTVGVILLDRQLRLSLANATARDLLAIGEDLPTYLPAPPITEVARTARTEDKPARSQIEVAYPALRTLQVEATPFKDGTEVLVVLQDISEEIRLQKVRRDFVAHASHELKSPVAGLQALTEALIQALDDDRDEALRFADRLLSESERLGKLVRDLLDLSRLEEADDPVHEPCDLSKVIADEVAHLRKEADEAGVNVVVDVQEPITISGDQAQLRLLVRNLLDNAVRYTPAGGDVTVRCRAGRRTGILEVEDTGIGIPAEARARIFERFYRVDRARSRARGGTGLGLAIVKHVTELHGGKIELSSELGSGSLFTISFPMPDRPVARKETA